MTAQSITREPLYASWDEGVHVELMLQLDADC